MEQMVIYLLMVQRLLNLKRKILKYCEKLCLGNISKDWSVDNMKNIRLKKGCVYNFSVDYDNISTSNVLDIHKYLMENNVIV